MPFPHPAINYLLDAAIIEVTPNAETLIIELNNLFFIYITRKSPEVVPAYK